MSASERAVPGTSAARTLATVALALALASPVLAQDRGRLIGRVAVLATEAPLPNAVVSIADSELSTRTDDDGFFVLRGVPTGPHTVEVSYGGVLSEPFELRMREDGEDQVFHLLLDVEPERLPPLEVTVDRPHPVSKMLGFHRRMGREAGWFITREEIEKINPRETSDVFRRIPGIRVRRGVRGRAPLELSRVRNCGIEFFVDGTPAARFSVDEIPPEDIAGIEVYRGVSEVPPRFRRADSCGAVVIWTRDSGG